MGQSCDLEALRAEASRTFPDYSIAAVRVRGGVATLELDGPDGAGAFGIGLRAEGTRLFTSVIDGRGGPPDSAEHARVAALVAGWYDVPGFQARLRPCTEAVSIPADQTADAVREAAAAALGTARLGAAREAGVVVGALALALLLVAWPCFRRRRAPAVRLRGAPGVDLALVAAIASLAVVIATVVAWRLGPEIDEVFTLGARHERFATLLSWRVGGEPFNPPGTSVLFGLWLRLAHGFFCARLFSIALIPFTAVLAYGAGRDLAGRAAGVSFAALALLAPSYLRLAAIARGYSLMVLALCALLAAIAASWRRPARGVGLGLAALLGVWMSYLLWPLALAAAWLARLERRDRVRVTAAVLLLAAALAPRIANGVPAALRRAETFELRGPGDALAYTLAAVGETAPGLYVHQALLPWLALAFAAALIAIAGLRATRGLGLVLGALALVVVPVLALLAGGHGIRERHVIAVQVVLALLAALGLARLLAARRGSAARRGGVLVAAVLVALAAIGNRALIAGATGWVERLDRYTAGADLIVLAPRAALMPVHAMLTGDAPTADAAMRWPPVCESDGEWWCRRIDGTPAVAIDRVDDQVLAAAAGAPRSVWIFAGEATSVPARLHGCATLLHDQTWHILECRGAALR